MAKTRNPSSSKCVKIGFIKLPKVKRYVQKPLTTKFGVVLREAAGGSIPVGR